MVTVIRRITRLAAPRISLFGEFSNAAVADLNGAERSSFAGVNGA
jgi:hypothetical protein